MTGSGSDVPVRDVDPAHADAHPAEIALAGGEYERLAALRAGLRAYLAWAESEARRHHTTPMQFQLMLAIQSSPAIHGPSISELAATLQLKHHSVVGLIDRAESVGLVHRARDTGNGARVRVTLTPSGSQRLDVLAQSHQRHLTSVAGPMATLWSAFIPDPRACADCGSDDHES